MLTPRELDQVQVALFAMAKTKINGRAIVDADHVFALLKTFTEGQIDIIADPDGDGLRINFTLAEEKVKSIKGELI